MDALKPHRVTIESVEYQGRKAVRVTPKEDSGAEDQLAPLGGPSFRRHAGAHGIPKSSSVFTCAPPTDAPRIRCAGITRRSTFRFPSFPGIGFAKSSRRSTSPAWILHRASGRLSKSSSMARPRSFTYTKLISDCVSAAGSAQPTLIVNDLKHGEFARRGGLLGRPRNRRALLESPDHSAIVRPPPTIGMGPVLISLSRVALAAWEAQPRASLPPYRR